MHTTCWMCTRISSFNVIDPNEDTESSFARRLDAIQCVFQRNRSERGY